MEEPPLGSGRGLRLVELGTVCAPGAEAERNEFVGGLPEIPDSLFRSGAGSSECFMRSFYALGDDLGDECMRFRGVVLDFDHDADGRPELFSEVDAQVGQAELFCARRPFEQVGDPEVGRHDTLALDRTKGGEVVLG